MTDLERRFIDAAPSRSGGSRERRQTVRELIRIDEATTRDLARIDAAVEIQQEQIRALNNIGTTALISTAQLSQTENTLAQMAPHASGRLAAIADLAAVQTAEILVDSARRVRRAAR
jgi:hypothetical protein